MTARALRLAMAMLPLLASAAAGNDVPLATQRLVKAHFAPQMVLPATAMWRFDTIKPYPGGGDVVCGKVNFQKSTRVYIGYLGFYAVVRGGVVGVGGIEAENVSQDPTGAFAFAYHNICGGN